MVRELTPNQNGRRINEDEIQHLEQLRTVTYAVVLTALKQMKRY